MRAIQTLESEPYVDRAEMARILGVHINTIDGWVRRGMPSETWGIRVRRFRPSLATQWVREHGRLDTVCENHRNTKGALAPRERPRA
jgi:phage terminase Nu1 subunit (DNA packaging protein)